MFFCGRSRLAQRAQKMRVPLRREEGSLSEREEGVFFCGGSGAQ
jgi:hypothetical protein